MAQEVTSQVIGEQLMGCPGCENAVQRALSQLPGIRQVNADHRTQRIAVRLEPTRTSAEAVQQRLQDLGYEAELVASTQTTA